MKPKLIVIGASYLQQPLIRKARDLGIETHVFAWEKGAVAKSDSDFFYPLSITDKESIVAEARKIRPDGIATIASDLAISTVNDIAVKLGLIGNSPDATLRSTNKREMRETLAAAGLPCPQFMKVERSEDAKACVFAPPVIVKPTDRSGSRGVTKVTDLAELPSAIERAIAESIEKKALIEEFVEGTEISVESISWEGEHHLLAITDKETTGAPYFVETGHHQPSRLPDLIKNEVMRIVPQALSCLGLQYGASHSELLIRADGRPCIVEIGGRMGGDCIGSHLVQLSTGYDFVAGVIEVALGRFSGVDKSHSSCAGIRYVTAPPGVVSEVQDRTHEYPEIVGKEVLVNIGDTVPELRESAQRLGFYIYAGGERFTPEESPLQVVTSPSQA